MVGASALVVAVPIGLLAAVAIKATSTGPVLFRQQRVGLDGRTFLIIKFRTMRVGTHTEVLANDDAFDRYADSGFKLPADDPRITAVGRFLRRTSIDELPQLLNIVAGDMSLVGPRPVEAAQLEHRSPADQALYESLRPGLTGVWQVSGRSTLPESQRIEIDSTYAHTWTMLGDLRIILATPAALLRPGETR